MYYILIIFLFYLVYTLAKNILRAFTMQPNHNGQDAPKQNFRKTYGKTHIDIIPEDKHATHTSSGEGEYIDYQEIK